MTGNTCSEDRYDGIQLKQSSSNEVSDNDSDGISLVDASDGNTVSNNHTGDSPFTLGDSELNTLISNTCAEINFRNSAATR